MKPRKGAPRLKVPPEAPCPIASCVEFREPTPKGFILHRGHVVMLKGMIIQATILDSREYREVKKKGKR